MRETAKKYLECFDLEFTTEGVQVKLNEDAPLTLLNLVSRIRGTHGAETLVCVFEALNCVADADSPSCCEIDEKICSSDILRIVLAELDKTTPDDNQHLL